MDNRSRTFVADFFVVGPVSQKKLLVVQQEWSRVGAALVPDEDAPSTRFEDARKFCPRSFAIKPVGGLGRSDEVYRSRSQSGRLGSAGDRSQVGEFLQQAIARFAHGGIGLDGRYGVAILQQKPGESSGSRSDVGNKMFWPQSAIGPQKFDNLRRISRTVADVIFHSIGKTGGWSSAHDFSV